MADAQREMTAAPVTLRPCRSPACGRQAAGGLYCCWRCHDAGAYAPPASLNPFTEDGIAALMHTAGCEARQNALGAALDAAAAAAAAHGSCGRCGGPRTLTRAALPGGAQLTALACAGSCPP